MQLLFAVILLIGLFGDSTALASSMPAADCAVVGVGVLGTLVCRALVQSASAVTGITRTETNHASIREQVTAGGNADHDSLLTLVTADHMNTPKFRNVLFCAPPSGFDDYPRAIQEAMDRYWLGPTEGGNFVFTSSGAVYGDDYDDDVVTEATPVAGDAASNPRVARLRRAEAVVLAAGGCCLRLAGLYNLQRGPHNYYLTQFGGGATNKKIEADPHGRVNMLHYEDAATACLAALRLEPAVAQKRIFLISDGHPTSRYDLCRYALSAAFYRDMRLPEFAASSSNAPRGKIYDGTLSNQMLQWTPRYTSFQAFMEANA